MWLFLLSEIFFKFIKPKAIKNAPTTRVIINVVCVDKYISFIYPSLNYRSGSLGMISVFMTPLKQIIYLF